MVLRVCWLTLVAVCTGSAFAGDLNPPAGPIAPTHKTLTQVEPRIPINATNTPGDADSVFRIAAAGSYYLTGNLGGAASKAGIEVTASNVTIDLSGYSMLGVAGSLSGIRVIGELSNLTVRNGVISGWSGDGIEAGSTFGALIEGLHFSGCGGRGLYVSNGSRVRDCTARLNTEDGMAIGYGSSVSGCTAASNGGNGIWIAGDTESAGGVVENCTASANGGQGFTLNAGGSVINCLASLNLQDGFGVARGTTVVSCTAYENELNGFTNTARNGGASTSGSGNTITGCTSYTNGGRGINMTNIGHVVEGNLVFDNLDDGIAVSSGSVVIRNNCRSNGPAEGEAAGIQVFNSDNRIEGNTCSGNNQGIDVDSSGNVIVRNVCSGNDTNWVVAIGNVCLVVSAATNGTAINGNSGGSSPGSIDPSTNYTY